MEIEELINTPKDNLSGINFTYRAYFEDGVKDAMAGKIPRHTITGAANCFVAVYMKGYERTLKLLKNIKKEDNAITA